MTPEQRSNFINKILASDHATLICGITLIDTMKKVRELLLRLEIVGIDAVFSRITVLHPETKTVAAEVLGCYKAIYNHQATLNK